MACEKCSANGDNVKHKQRESAEKAVNLFGEVPNAISYIYYILATDSERITFPFILIME